MDPATAKHVLSILMKFKSMPFLELTSLSDVGDQKLEEIVKDLAQRDLVKVSNPDNIYERIVTVKDKAFMPAR
jgi:hypothetical protein